MRILLLGSGGSAANNFVKSLKKSTQQYTVYGADMNQYYLAACNADYKVHLNYSNPEKKLESIKEVVSKYGIDLIHAQPDPEVKFLLQHKHELSNYIFNHKLYLWEHFADKLHCAKTWGAEIAPFQAHGFRDVVSNPKLFEQTMEAGGGKVWLRAVIGAGSRAALPVTKWKQALNWVNYWNQEKGLGYDDFMISEFLPGAEYAVQTFWMNGRLIHAQARQRMIYVFGNLMVSGQSSTPAVAKTIDNDYVYQAAYAAIQGFDKNPHGIYCVDLKEKADGTIIPMEVNYGRFFTTSDFFASIGINTPAVYCNAFLGGSVCDKDIRINCLQDEYLWIRTMDNEPHLHKNVVL